MFQPRKFNDGSTLDSRAATFLSRLATGKELLCQLDVSLEPYLVVHNNTSVMLLETKYHGRAKPLEATCLVRNRRKENQAVQAEAQHTRENTQPRQNYCYWLTT